MESAQSIDDLIVCLMSMGFELEDCQQAVQAGKLSVQDAVDWLLNGKPPVPSGAPGGPKLKLQQGVGIGISNPFSAIPIDMSGQDASSSGAMNDEEDEDLLKSRMNLNMEQRQIKEKFMEKQRDEARKFVKEEKMQQKRAHAEALKRIAEDREKKKPTKHPSSPPKSPKPSDEPTSPISTESTSSVAMPISSVNTDAAGVASSSPSSLLSASACSTAIDSTPASDVPPAQKCAIQIRLPNGSAVKHVCCADSTLKHVWDFVATKHQKMENMCLMQPFPHKVFSNDDLQVSLQDLGLVPSASLVLKAAENTPKPADVAPVLPVPPVPADLASAGLPRSFVGGRRPPVAFMEEHEEEGDQGVSHHWGLGNQLDTGNFVQDDEAMAVDRDNGQVDDDEMGDDMPPDFRNMFAPGGQNHHLNPVLAGMPGIPQGQHRGLHVWGDGQRLATEDGHPPGEHQQRLAGQLAADAARQRFGIPEAIPNNQPTASTSGTASRQAPIIPLLLQLCLRHMTSRLCDPHNPILTLGGVSEEIAQKLLQHIVKEKLLKPKLLQPFMACRIQKMCLDSYPYATNELLTALRFHTYLKHLSLKDCPLITDAGLAHISGLKRLKVLNLSLCKPLTNKCLSSISQLPELKVLVLEGTHVNDDGMEQFLPACPHTLQHLNLSKTKITHRIFPLLQGLPALKKLFLEQTQVTSLSGVQMLKHLDSLDISRTAIITDSLLCLSNMQSLVYLNISNTDSVDGDLALGYIKDLPLQQLGLPNRMSTTNVGMQHLVNLPLLMLDLTNYINISDEGIKHIGSITSLRRLMLSNTKITDEGILYLQGLHNLEVLHLDRTLITDTGASLIQDFRCLTELSLSSVSVSSRFLKTTHLNTCNSLTKINLSRTQVTDRGVKCLRLPYLALLNLDSTCVNPDIASYLNESCPRLHSVILHNLTPTPAKDDIDEVEEEAPMELGI